MNKKNQDLSHSKNRHQCKPFNTASGQKSINPTINQQHFKQFCNRCNYATSISHHSLFALNSITHIYICTNYFLPTQQQLYLLENIFPSNFTSSVGLQVPSTLKYYTNTIKPTSHQKKITRIQDIIFQIIQIQKRKESNILHHKRDCDCIYIQLFCLIKTLNLLENKITFQFYQFYLVYKLYGYCIYCNYFFKMLYECNNVYFLGRGGIVWIWIYLQYFINVVKI
eukprot:TRINITY_DN7514_c0_g1_i1.p1 TRINITY_DN7514_c0_g1~~TRINITY_DN7514_c0_g1_i1.p1  ORF type:complete len:225 (-),score=-21.75 TRINITY_DN7514_c0_g1_i1:77-751(-)